MSNITLDTLKKQLQTLAQDFTQLRQELVATGKLPKAVAFVVEEVKAFIAKLNYFDGIQDKSQLDNKGEALLADLKTAIPDFLAKYAAAPESQQKQLVSYKTKAEEIFKKLLNVAVATSDFLISGGRLTITMPKTAYQITWLLILNAAGNTISACLMNGNALGGKEFTFTTKAYVKNAKYRVVAYESKSSTKCVVEQFTYTGEQFIVVVIPENKSLQPVKNNTNKKDSYKFLNDLILKYGTLNAKISKSRTDCKEYIDEYKLNVITPLAVAFETAKKNVDDASKAHKDILTADANMWAAMWAITGVVALSALSSSGSIVTLLNKVAPTIDLSLSGF